MPRRKFECGANPVRICCKAGSDLVRASSNTSTSSSGGTPRHASQLRTYVRNSRADLTLEGIITALALPRSFASPACLVGRRPPGIVQCLQLRTYGRTYARTYVRTHVILSSMSGGHGSRAATQFRLARSPGQRRSHAAPRTPTMHAYLILPPTSSSGGIITAAALPRSCASHARTARTMPTETAIDFPSCSSLTSNSQKSFLENRTTEQQNNLRTHVEHV